MVRLKNLVSESVVICGQLLKCPILDLCPTNWFLSFRIKNLVLFFFIRFYFEFQSFFMKREKDFLLILYESSFMSLEDQCSCGAIG